ncbi:Cys-tRNA(Pro) deacylase [Aliamphritea ceti]|uniref:Cys-tRNA(Pro) deacylase n=1 Tax=Aliamphritea ceti TaxID=1524258 RepID=UPI0021C28E98|nr:Cys-tRNA(Pro) deacylase [Aliamphritea ceti]
MTPAITLAEKQAVSHQVHSYSHDPNCESYGDEAAQALNINPGQVYKTLMVALNGDNKQLAVAIVPVAAQLNLKAAAKAFKVKKIAMADPQAAQRSSGYLLGGISPLGQKKALPTLLDSSAENWPTVFVSAGKRGLEIELQATDLLLLSKGQFADLTG